MLPFYIIKYEKSKERLSEDDEYLQQMLTEYKEIQKYLEKELWNGKQINSVNNYKNLVDLIGRIVDYILENTEKARKGVREVMGGKVLELATEREERLRREREEKLSREGREEGQESILKAQIQKKLQKQKSISEIAEELETDQATVRRIMKKLGQAQV